MKLLEAIKHLYSFTNDAWHLFQVCLENRRDWFEEREPECGGATYENWEMKFEDWCEICELCEEVVSQLNSEQDISENIDELVDLILSFQYSYGGLSRLKIW